MAVKPKSIIFKSQTKFSTTNSLSAKSIGNSNDYGQLKSIATTVHDQRRLSATEGQSRQRPMEESINQRQWKPTTNDEVQRSTITCIDNVRQFASRLAYLLSVASLSHSRWPTISKIKQQPTNKIIYPEIKDRKTIAAIGKERVGGSYLCPATVMLHCSTVYIHRSYRPL